MILFQKSPKLSVRIDAGQGFLTYKNRFLLAPGFKDGFYSLVSVIGKKILNFQFLNFARIVPLNSICAIVSVYLLKAISYNTIG